MPDLRCRPRYDASFEPDADDSFLVITDQATFDQVFGVAFVMQDRSHRLPKDAFKSTLVVAVIKRGNAFCEFKVESVTVEKGVIQLRYTVTSKATPETTFACPPIVSIPRGEYQSVVFIDGGKQVKTLKIDSRQRGTERP